ncbi:MULTISPECIES: phage baseplate assembly protein V [Burkholderia]|uniref:Rhs element Vgr protein n=1 Tax=Burkholderia gladioli TaxID=28095 RepID=A0A2A7SG48_BURGA|nr:MULTISPECIES: phage baseplate assembly protein V [Burkholderia]ATF87446.1 Rhs element Vgr protein [Burkholderia gladioli pv. gladioli]MBJ9660016.1 Rhs element Vgr protein [Burkholderia gladioli]MBJ9711502.1 Rhs element Vgr protein [Burkholderia gladioli]MBU9157714.1 Rhs element Vgr protein [Burkholderia gladioli]MBU9169777.1 Rhs element Vgr protein [Burkholderia gladioli]
MSPSPSLSPESLALGVTLGKVADTRDPEGYGRVKLSFLLKGAEIESDWAQIASFFAGPNSGAFFLPQPGDAALIAFADGDASKPYVIGFLWNGAQKPPVPVDQQQDLRVIRTKGGKTITLDDSPNGGGVTIVDARQNRIRIDSATNAIELASEGDLSITAKGKLTITGAQVTLRNTAGSVKATLGQATLDVQGGQNLKLSATMIDLN